MKANLIKKTTGIYKIECDGKLIASTDDDMNKHLEISKLSLKNCQAIERGYDSDELAEKWVFETNGHKWSNNDDTAGDNYLSFRVGFQKAIELLGDKKFSEEDIRQALYLKNGFDKDGFYFYKSDEEIIQSLQQTEWDVEIEMEFVGRGKHGIGSEVNHYMPKRDVDGCLILKRV